MQITGRLRHLQRDLARVVEAPAVEHVHHRDVRLLLHTEVLGSKSEHGARVAWACERCADLRCAHCGACRSSERAARQWKVGLSIYNGVKQADHQYSATAYR